MNPTTIQAIQASWKSLLNKETSFLSHVQHLIEVGVVKYHVDLPEGYIQYQNNTQATHTEPLSTSFAVKSDFCKDKLVKAIQWAQQNDPDYTYLSFLQQIAKGGVAAYTVDIQAKRVDYCGLKGQHHTEFFPSSPKH